MKIYPFKLKMTNFLYLGGCIVLETASFCHLLGTAQSCLNLFCSCKLVRKGESL